MSDEKLDVVVTLRAVREENPYPVDIFTKPSHEEWLKVQKLFKDAGLVQDKFFGAYGRKVWNNCCDRLEDKLKEEEVD